VPDPVAVKVSGGGAHQVVVEQAGQRPQVLGG
jgi:hypothetical protein